MYISVSGNSYGNLTLLSIPDIKVNFIILDAVVLLTFFNTDNWTNATDREYIKQVQMQDFFHMNSILVTSTPYWRILKGQ